MSKPLSSLDLYLTVAHDTDTMVTLGKWRSDVPDLDEEIWEETVSAYIPSMIASRDRFIQLKFLHRAYYTPQRLANIYPSPSPLCTRCALEKGSFFHMVWTCPSIRPYWQEVPEHPDGDLWSSSTTEPPSYSCLVRGCGGRQIYQIVYDLRHILCQKRNLAALFLRSSRMNRG